MAEYYNVTTNIGDAEIAQAIVNNTKLNITHIAFGDGNGAVPTPSKTRTTLVREVYRQAVTKYERHPTVANWIIIETIIPSNVGGFWVREMGVIADGKMISHGSHAPFEKVSDPSGVSEYRLKFTQDIRDGNVVSITLDQSLIYASQAWVEENYIKRSEIVDNLITDASNKPLSAKQGKILQDNKLDKTENAVSATKLLTARTVSFSGAATGSFSYNGSANSSCVLTLANSGVVAGSYASTIQIPQISVNAKGQITAVSQVDIRSASVTQSGVVQLADDLTTDDSTKPLTAKQGKVLQDNKLEKTANAVSATKLLNTRKIFGQDFNATSDVEGTVTTSTGMIKSDEYHYIDIGKSGLDRMNLAIYGGIFNFIDSQNGNIVARLNSNGIDCNAASASKLKNARKINNIDFDATSDINITAPMRNLGDMNDANTALSDGFYVVSGKNIMGMYGYGILEVRNSGSTIHQTYYSHQKNSVGSVAVRQSWGGGENFTVWRSLDPIGTASLTGAVSGSANFDGSGNININVALNNFSSLKSQNGYKYLGDGTIIQWGTFDYASLPEELEQNFTFPVVFPNACLNVSLTRKMLAHSSKGDGGVLLISSNQSSAKVSVQNFTTERDLLRGFTWMAIGY